MSVSVISTYEIFHHRVKNMLSCDENLGAHWHPISPHISPQTHIERWTLSVLISIPMFPVMLCRMLHYEVSQPSNPNRSQSIGTTWRGRGFRYTTCPCRLTTNRVSTHPISHTGHGSPNQSVTLTSGVGCASSNIKSSQMACNRCFCPPLKKP